MSLHPATAAKVMQARHELFLMLKTLLNVQQVDLPLYIPIDSPYNDNLNGEPPVKFHGKNGVEYQIVHSHALLKRKHINQYADYYRELTPIFTQQTTTTIDTTTELYNIKPEYQYVSIFDDKGHEIDIKTTTQHQQQSQIQQQPYIPQSPNGIFSFMIAIRKCEDLDPTHSMLVRQFDWCVRIPTCTDAQQGAKLQITRLFITKIAFAVYTMLQRYSDEKLLPILHSQYKTSFPGICIKSSRDFVLENTTALDTVTTLEEFETIRTKWEQQLGQKYYFFAITEIGAKLTLPNGTVLPYEYDKRSHKYDDHQSNADIFVWSESMQRSIEISSMGFRVNAESLQRQLDASGINPDQYDDYVKNVLNNQVVQTIGGGIGVDRLSLLLIGATTIQDILEF